ncbi:hypothetical protein GGF31_007230 [Allomyces arbusculus]|nr:hypothetical protein GGF31_007230 [Allomyces arbusculus]
MSTTNHSSPPPGRTLLLFRAAVAILAIVAVLASAPVHARPQSASPSTATAPSRDVLTSFCLATTSTPLGACSLLAQCGSSTTKPYCSTLSLLDALCNYDNPTTDVCTQYQAYCTAKPSDCRADGNTAWPAWTNSTVYQNQIYRMCKVHNMEGCDKCTNPASSLSVPLAQLASCDSFAVYVAMCKAMPDMTMCNVPWKRMCQANPTATKDNFPQICPASAFDGSAVPTTSPSTPSTSSSSPSTSLDEGGDLDIPPMRMYFHQDTHDLLLFRSWVTRTAGSYAAASVGVFLVTVAYYALQAVVRGVVTPRLSASLAAATPGIKRELLVAARALVATTEIAFSFLLMLVVMTFNWGWCAMVLLGAFVGNYAFNRGSGRKAALQAMMGADGAASDAPLNGAGQAALAPAKEPFAQPLCC